VDIALAPDGCRCANHEGQRAIASKLSDPYEYRADGRPRFNHLFILFLKVSSTIAI
jgi:hypothetical protein